MILQGDCQRCGTHWQELFYINDKMVGKACGCYDFEQEITSGKAELDREKLDEYKSLVARGGGISPSTY